MSISDSRLLVPAPAPARTRCDVRAHRRVRAHGRAGAASLAGAVGDAAAERRAGADRRSRADGQSLVEFSLILGPLFLLLLGVIQFGFVFNTYVTVSTAAREAAREGSIYVYDRTLSKTTNDAARNATIRTALLASLNGLTKTAPNFTNGVTWTSTTSGSTTTYTNGDITVTYVQPASITTNDPRQGYQVTVRATYHLDLIIPLIGDFLPKDAGGRLPLAGEVTMVIN
jgi:Flp pilus assembly protein TadG